MTWTYSGDPRDSEVDAIRFLIGDVNTNDQLINDEEILYLISTEPTTLQRAIVAANTILLSFAMLIDKSVGDLKISASQRHKNYMAVIVMLEDRAGASAGLPFAGGISVTDKTAREGKSDRVKPAFKVDMNRNTRLR